MQANCTLTSLNLHYNGVTDELSAVIRAALQVAPLVVLLVSGCWLCQRNIAFPPLLALLAADVARLWPASSASAPLPPSAPVWSAFFGHPWLFERHVLGLVAGFAGGCTVLRDVLVAACAVVYRHARLRTATLP